MPLFAAGG